MSTIFNNKDEEIRISNNKYEYRQKDKIGAGSYGSINILPICLLRFSTFPFCL